MSNKLRPILPSIIASSSTTITIDQEQQYETLLPPINVIIESEDTAAPIMQPSSCRMISFPSTAADPYHGMQPLISIRSILDSIARPEKSASNITGMDEAAVLPTISPAPSSSNVEGAQKHRIVQPYTKKKCASCGTESTPLWRKGDHRENLW